MDDWEWWPFGKRRNIFREIDRMIEEMFREFRELVPKEMFRVQKLPDGSTVKSFGPIVYGYSMTIGPDGVPRIKTFGNVKPTPLPQPTETREPLVEIIPSPPIIRVVAELPGVRKEDIDLRVTENKLIISAESGERKYYREVELPSRVDPKNVDAYYNNGVLDVILREVEGKKEGEKVNIK